MFHESFTSAIGSDIFCWCHLPSRNNAIEFFSSRISFLKFFTLYVIFDFVVGEMEIVVTLVLAS